MFSVDADIRKAKTLSSDFYTDEGFFEASKESIFAKSWHFVGSVQEVDNLRPVNLLEGFLDEPVLLSRSGDSVECMSNVCTHRGKILIEEPCRADLIRCSYHGRRFKLDGKFLSMPEFDDVADFPTGADDLTPVALDRWGTFLFASVDPFTPFADHISDVRGEIDMEMYEEAAFSAARSYEVDAHWALYCENYLEGFHIPYVHRSLNEIVDYGSYTTRTFRYSSLQTGKGKDGQVQAQYLFIFPNLMFNFYPWGISVNVVRPFSVSKTIVDFITYVSDESKIDTGAGADLDRVELEDEAVVESVQKGISSRFYKNGRYSPSREQGTHHFHRLICEFMAVS
jgi:choline monooxygenase